MLGSIRRFFKRHQNKFIAGGIVIGGVFLLTRYTQRRLREWQQKEIKKFVENSKKRQHFENLQETCNNLTVTSAGNVRNEIIKTFDTQSIIEQLKNSPTDKIALWTELKVLSIARTAAIVYAYSILATFIKIQVSLISGYIYKNSTTGKDEVGWDDAQMKYLQICMHFISNGVKKLCNLVKQKVEVITTAYSLDTQLTLRELEQIYWSVASSVFADTANDPINNLADYMMLQSNDRSEESPVYKRIIDQTLDLLESDEVQNLMQQQVRIGFAALIDNVSKFFGNTSHENGILRPRVSRSPNKEAIAARSPEKATLKNSEEATPRNSEKETPRKLEEATSKNSAEEATTRSSEEEATSRSSEEKVMPSTSGDSYTFVDINKVTLPLAKIIPIMIGQVPNDAVPMDMSSIWLQSLMQHNDIKTLGANIYEAMSCQTNI